MVCRIQVFSFLAILFFFTYADAATLVITDKESTPSRTSLTSDGKIMTGIRSSEASSIPSPAAKISRDCSSFQGGVGASLTVMQGDILSQRITEWARGYGYTVSWEAPELRADGGLTSNKDFDGTLIEFKRAMEINGINIDIITYNNCVVRIVEVK